MLKSKFSSVCLIVSLICSPISLAADEELYDAPPPDDAAFVRWIGKEAAPSVLGLVSIDSEGSVYRPVSAAVSEDLKEGAFYSAAMDASGQLVVLQEPSRSDRTKVHLLLVNLSDQAVRVILVGKNLVVIEETGVNSTGIRAVNPVKVELRVETVSGSPLGTFEVVLRRGQNLTFVARNGQAELIENRFGTNYEG